jgi:small subunit ribosomal protein S9
MPKKIKDIQFYEAVGRRKEAVARVRLYITGKDKTATIKDKKLNQGDIVINDLPLVQAYNRLADQKRCLEPYALTKNTDRFVTTIHVTGGGKSGQLDAIVHGISRALNLMNTEEYRPTLKAKGLLTRDPRTRERRMVGTGGKSRRAKQSPKR